MAAHSFYHGRRVLVTGHTGFKGAWLTLWLLRCGATVSGCSLGAPTNPALFDLLGLAAEISHHTCDIRNAGALEEVLRRERPEIVFHLAAQPLVRRSHALPRETFEVNVGGTVNLFEAVRAVDSVRAVVVVTSDKCYAEGGWPHGHRESDALGGRDPYSASKAAAELVAASYRDAFLDRTGVGVATVRAGNVIGGGDWAEDRIVPDCIRALTAGNVVEVRNPSAVRPWQHVLEPLAGYLLLGERLVVEPSRYAGAWNFGPRAGSSRCVGDLVAEVVRCWGEGSWQATPQHAAPAESPSLRLCSDRAMTLLPWRPRWGFRGAVRRTVAWYRAFRDGAGAAALRAMCLEQIAEREAASASRSVTWHPAA